RSRSGHPPRARPRPPDDPCVRSAPRRTPRRVAHERRAPPSELRLLEHPHSVRGRGARPPALVTCTRHTPLLCVFFPAPSSALLFSLFQGSVVVFLLWGIAPGSRRNNCRSLK